MEIRGRLLYHLAKKESVTIAPEKSSLKYEAPLEPKNHGFNLSINTMLLTERFVLPHLNRRQ